VSREPQDLEELHDEGYEDEEVDDEDVDLSAESDDGEVEAEADEDVGSSDEDDEDGASLDELLARRAAASGDSDDQDDEADIMSLTSESVVAHSEPQAPVRVAPVRERQEFVCNNCHLVKPRVQLADAGRGLCRDCA
jgi:Domain of unknown function (DUF4193)